MGATKVLYREKVLAPKLRFKGFDSGWKKFLMNEIATKITDGTHDTPKQISEGVPYLTAIHVKDGKIDFDKSYYLDQKDHNIIYKRCNPELGDLLVVNIGAGTATCASVTVDYEFSLKNVALIKPNRKIVYPDYLSQLQRKNAKKLFLQLTSGGAQPFLSLKEIGKLKISIPTLPEQQKIACFLSAVDEKIQQLTRKKELLEQFKKGVMQQLFFGKLRFKDEGGKAFPKWEDKRLGDVGDTFNGLTGKTKEDFGEGKPYIQYMQIFTSSKIDVTKCGLVQIGDNENQPRVQYGDVFFTTSSETPNEIGTCSVLLEETKEMYLNSFCFGFRPNSLEQLVPNFASYLFRNEVFRKKIIKLAQGSTRYNMSKVQLLKLRISLPSNNEQKKIANYLSNIDNKIESVNKQITETQTFKKGLLQQMFV